MASLLFLFEFLYRYLQGACCWLAGVLHVSDDVVVQSQHDAVSSRKLPLASKHFCLGKMHL